MRPLTLTMQAFGSYGRETTISFQETNQNFFLISGNTGAGKTTIFDAIVFALYGEASSGINKKDGAELQSQYAGLDREPFVELTFSDGAGWETWDAAGCDTADRNDWETSDMAGRETSGGTGRKKSDVAGQQRSDGNSHIYTVRRVPRHQRPLRRGSGVKNESGSVCLIMPDGSQYPQKETDRKLEEIVGLTKEQFMQVAMIAQGEFMELLRAKSDDKKEIFRKLFHTELFQQIGDELGRRKKEKEREIASIRTVCQTEAAHVTVPEDYEGASRLEQVKKRITEGDRLTVTDLECLLEELELLVKELKEKRAQALEVCQEAGKRRDETREACARALELEKMFRQLDEAAAELEWCRQQEGRIQEGERLAADLRAAYEILAEYNRYKDTADGEAEMEKQLEKQQKAWPELVRKTSETAEAETEAKKQYETEVEAFSAVSERVQKALELFEKIRVAGEEMAEKEEASKKAGEILVKREKALRELTEKEEGWRRQAEELKDAQRLELLWQGKQKEAERLVTEAEEGERKAGEVTKQREKAEEARTRYGEASRRYEEKNREYEEARKVFLDAQAGFLARELQPGRPCPVCGALEHPAPCPWKEEHQEMTREGLEQLEEQVKELRTGQENLAAQARSDGDMLVEKKQILEESLRKLLSHMALCMGKEVGFREENLELAASNYQILECVKEQIASWKKDVEAEGEQLRENVRKLTEIQGLLLEADKEKNQLTEALEEARRQETLAAADLKGSKKALEDLERSKEYATAEEAEGVLTEAKNRKDEKNHRYEQARAAAREARTEQDNCQALMTNYEQELPRKKELARERSIAYEKLMEEKALEEGQWKALTESHEKEEADRLQKEAEEYYRRKAAAGQTAKWAGEHTDGQERPDEERLNEEKDKAQEGYEQAEQMLNRYTGLLETNARAWEGLSRQMEQRRQTVEDHARLDRLYRLITGNVSGSRMDLETYVQRCYLERILDAANRRFLEMSAGQFELRMCQLEKAGEGRNKGLDLMVYSAVTGKEREIRTLSGGESFLAALSLALGMADQIQERTGGIHLDMMFIDEGFGSLDDHSRNQAVRVLREMAGGTRLIGIISHVAELKQEIEDQLSVEKDQWGSRVKWEIS